MILSEKPEVNFLEIPDDRLDLGVLKIYLKMRKALEILVILHLISEIYFEIQGKISMNKKERLQKKKQS
ncbi:TPA: hypothetical protein DEG21_03980 [Patescibacteria group bacterium]|nr:hypothetical protein [Candidatus Gracilibacteria bacterium]HBY75007.1 hypothetical protein [Candidatus Gracilibacteria bacterium]